MALENQVTYGLDEEVDFVVIGSGSAGGIIAKELATNGFSVVVLEQGPFRTASDFTHDELSVFVFEELQGGGNRNNQQTFRSDESEVAELPAQRGPAFYAQGVGGSSVHFTGNFWRLREVDFKERSLLGPIEGTNFADWPIDYAELEPYYTRVDWEIGISGAPGPDDSFRSRPFPMPPMPIKSSGVLMERGAEKLGWSVQPEPHAILSQPLNGRPACINCGYCMGFGCEADAKYAIQITNFGSAYSRLDEEFLYLGWNFDGQEVFKRAIKSMAQACEDVLAQAGLSKEDVNLVVPHQANKRILDALAKRIDIPEERIMINVHKYGNTSAGTIPVALAEAVEEKRVKPGDYLLMASFGAGLTWGAGLVKWGDRVDPLKLSDASLPPCDKTALEILEPHIKRYAAHQASAS